MLDVQLPVRVELRRGDSEEGAFQDVPFDERSDGFHLCVLHNDVVARLDVDPLGRSRAGSVQVDENRHLSSVRKFSQDDRFAGADRNVAVQRRVACLASGTAVRFGDRDGFQNVEVAVTRERVFAAAEQASGVEQFVVSRRDENDVAVFQDDVAFAEVDGFVLLKAQWDAN